MSEAFVVNSSKPPVRRRAQGHPQHGVDDAAVAAHDDRAAGVAGDDVADGDADPVVQLGERLAARERDGVGVGLPVGHAVAGEELVERQPVAVRAGVVLAEPGLDVHLGVRRTPGAISSAVSIARG